MRVFLLQFPCNLSFSSIIKVRSYLVMSTPYILSYYNRVGHPLEYLMLCKIFGLCLVHNDNYNNYAQAFPVDLGYVVNESNSLSENANGSVQLSQKGCS
jgi:hypothetical protein